MMLHEHQSCHSVQHKKMVLFASRDSREKYYETYTVTNYPQWQQHGTTNNQPLSKTLKAAPFTSLHLITSWHSHSESDDQMT